MSLVKRNWDLGNILLAGLWSSLVYLYMFNTYLLVRFPAGFELYLLNISNFLSWIERQFKNPQQTMSTSFFSCTKFNCHLVLNHRFFTRFWIIDYSALLWIVDGIFWKEKTLKNLLISIYKSIQWLPQREYSTPETRKMSLVNGVSFRGLNC